jgi:hypothetical protein
MRKLHENELIGKLIFGLILKLYLMTPGDFFREKFRELSTKNIVYYIFPVLLIVLLYLSYIPFNQNYIGEWHDIFANSLYYTITGHDYLAPWNNLWAGGFPLTANPHSDKYYIFSFPFYLIFQNLTIVNFIILFHLLIAYFTFFKLGSLITRNNNVLLIFSVFYAFSGVMLGRIYGGHHLLLYGLAWLPLIYYFFFKMVLYKETNVWNMAGFTLASTLVYLTGNLYHFILIYLLLLVFFAYYAITGQISRKMVYYLVLSVILTSLLLSIKVIPDMGVTSAVIRQDIIDPLAGGGSLETDFSSFLFGIRIDSLWAQYESGVMIGVIPILLMIVALLYGRKEIAIPAYFGILFSLIWAGAGKTVFFFLHLLPVVDNLRNPGRILGALLPVILFLALYGTIILYEKLKNREALNLSAEQQKLVATGLGLLLLVKLFELPYQEMITGESLVSVILIAAFIGLLYFRKGSIRNILLFFIIALVANAAVLLAVYPVIPSSPVLCGLLLIGLLLAGFFIFVDRGSEKTNPFRLLCGILLAGIFIMMVGNIGSSYVTLYKPQVDESPAQEIIRQVRNTTPANTPLVVYETGVPIWHMDFTYWDMVSGIRPLSVYSAYYLKTLPEVSYTIGNVTYFTPDYIVDTQYRENGQRNIPNVTFKVQNISVFVPDRVLPTVFAIRNDQLIPLTLDKYLPGNVIASGNLQSGDIVVLKENYYKGWKVNGADANPDGTMISTRLKADTSTVMFTFDPFDYKIGALLSGLGVIIIILLLFKRKEADGYFSRVVPQTEIRKADTRSKKKKRK